MEDESLSLSDQKLKEEIENLRLERQKLLRDATDARRPYLLRNAQILTALIATAGALIGLYLTIKTDYFAKLRLEGELSEKVAKLNQQEAERAQKEANAQKLDADRAMHSARTQKQDADKLKHQADEEKISAERMKADSARQVVTARMQLERVRAQANQANLEVFKASSAPYYLYSQQSQFSAMELYSFGLRGYGWLTTHNLKQISCYLNDSDTLRAIPSSVRELSVVTRTPDIDLRDFGNLSGLRKLAIRDYSGARTAFEVKGLSGAINLEEIAIEPSAPTMLGIDAIATLPNIKSVSVTAGSLGDLPAVVLDRATRIKLRDRVPKSDYASLAKNINLRTLVIPAYASPAEWRSALGGPKLTALVLEMGSVDFDPSDKFPRIVSLDVVVRTLDEAVKAMGAFPNLTDLSVRYFDTADISVPQTLLDLIEKSTRI